MAAASCAVPTNRDATSIGTLTSVMVLQDREELDRLRNLIAQERETADRSPTVFVMHLCLGAVAAYILCMFVCTYRSSRGTRTLPGWKKTLCMPRRGLKAKSRSWSKKSRCQRHLFAPVRPRAFHQHANTHRWLRGPSATLMRNLCHSSKVLPIMRCALQRAHRGWGHSGWGVDKHFHMVHVSYLC